MKLHIGCGNKFLPGYIHLDAMKYDHVDYITEADNLDMFEDNSVDEIYACHILEHFGRNENERVLQEWHRVLKNRGILRVAVPNFEAIAKAYLEKKQGLDKLMGLLYGGQNYKYNFHMQTFDFDRLRDILERCGFGDVNLYDWNEFLPEGFDDFSRAYLPHMDFENGTLMSLNVFCQKG